MDGVQVFSVHYAEYKNGQNDKRYHLVLVT